MGEQTGISWTNHTFNPWWGCVRISPGCKNCYAADLASRYGQGWKPESERRFMTAAWNDPPRWNRAAQKAGKPAFVFCASMADIFEDVPEHVREQTEEARARLWELIDATPWLVWLLLTKRPERVAETVPHAWMSGGWPSSAWIGCTVEDQEHADKRLPHLLDVPAPRHFVSYEPALGPVDWRPWLVDPTLCPCGSWSWSDVGGAIEATCTACGRSEFDGGVRMFDRRIDWIIIGGESGSSARPFRVEWARDTIRQCKEAGVSAWMKQLGNRPMFTNASGVGVGMTGIRAHHGAGPTEWPDDLRVQQRPDPATPKS